MPPKRPTSAAASSAAPVNDQVLSMKDKTLFSQVIRFYEMKQYKKALKSADAILKKTPNHGETLAMKGLTYNQMNKRDEAYTLVKKGLAADIKSHVCWHVYGLIYRSEFKYDDAIKCYQNALKRDPNNNQILKDLSNLQIQRRMLDGFVETRRRLLQQKSNNKHNWLAFAISHHLTGNTTQALKILDTLRDTTDMGQRAANDKRPVSFEESEMHLYRVMLLDEGGKTEEALKYLNENAREILDGFYMREKKGQLHLKLGQLKESESEYRKLLLINPENYSYHIGLLKALGLIDAKSPELKSFLNLKFTAAEAEAILNFYQKDEVITTNKIFTKSAAVKRLPLNFSSGAVFRDLVSAYLKEKISKGIPSLFSDLEPLYTDADKGKIIGEVMEEFLANLRKTNKFAKSDADDSESPSSFMYALYFQAQHYDHLNDPTKALALVDESIAHTVTNPDTYMLKARIYKHAGDPLTAYAYMDNARKLDTQDRYLNTKCVRYAWRADKLKEAEDTVSLFLRDGDGLKALEDLQVCWYENNAAESHIRQKQYGRALKKLLSIDKHFNDYWEDQFDFHSYCLRKTTLRAYVEMIRWANTLRGHRYHVRAAFNLVKVYLRLFDAPKEEEAELDALAVEKNMSEEEKKEHAKRLKQAAKKAQQAAEKKAAAEAAERAAANKGKAPKDVDPDPEGFKLLEIADPLAAATKYLQHLTSQCSNLLATHTLAVAIYVRKSKFALALRYLKKALAIDAQHPDTHLALCSFIQAIKKEGELEKLNPLVREVIEKELSSAAFGAGTPVDKLNSTFLSAHSSSLAHRLSAARVTLNVNPSDVATRANAQKLAAKIDSKESFTRGEASESLSFLRDTLKASDEVLAEFQKAALAKFPFAVVFGAQPNIPRAVDAPEVAQ